MLNTFQKHSPVRFFLVLISLLFLSTNASAQLSEGGIPYSFKNTLINPVATVEMPPVDVPALLAEDELDDLKGIPFRFGYPIETNLDLKRDGTFELLSNGDKLWSLRIYAPGASSINLNYNDFWLPEGGRLFIFNDAHNEVIGAFTKRNNKENGEFATGILRGEGVTLEYYEPAVVESPGIINISSVIYGYKDVFKKMETDNFGQSGWCNINTICPEGDPWRNEIRAVAMILTAGGSRLCSGSMINNVRQDLTPYFLTANHCVGSGSQNWIIMFRYQSPQCTPSVNGPLNYTVQGTQLKASNTASDFALFLLNEAPPDSYEVHFAGWSAIDVPSTNSVGIHHPRGDVKKISFDLNPPTHSSWSGTPPNSHWRVGQWEFGTTEPGSSGSPLFDQNHRITGQLHGGLASCTVIDYDAYGKFSFTWNYGSTPSTRAKDWLDPDNTGTLVLDGWDPTIGDPDTIPPTPITDLAVIDPTSNSLRLTWTAPLDTSYGGVKAYDIRMSNSPINDLTSFLNAQQIPFPGQPASYGTPESIEVTGLDFNLTYYFAIRSRDFWNNWSGISNSHGGTTLFAPQVGVNPVSVYHALMQNTVFVDTVFVSNISSNASTLDYSITLDNNTFPGGMVDFKVIPAKNISAERLDNTMKDVEVQYYGVSIDGMGGPDLFGYKWIDSNEPNGPAYVWEDISSTGTQVTNWIATGTFAPRDEGYAGPLPIGFNFKFYGNPKTDAYISTNGLVMFGPVSQNIFTNAQIPNSAVPNEFIAPFWDDLDGRNQGTVHYQTIGNKFIVQFTNWQRYPTTGSLTFQVVLYQNGKILVYYNNMNVTLNSATIGIENAAGNDGLQVAYNANYVQNNMALQFAAEPDWLSTNNSSGRIYNGNSVAVELTFRTEDYQLGNYSMDMIIASNDPVTPSLVVPVLMDIVIPVELSALSAASDRNNVILKWSTATETNNQGFVVERKHKDNNEWIEAAFISGTGNSTEIVNYSYTDKALQIGQYIYRLKQIDFDGTFSYSPEIQVDVNAPEDFVLYQNYPNPFNPVTTIEFSLPVNAEVTVKIFTALGELVTTVVNGKAEAGYHKVSFDASGLTSGVYIYRIMANADGKNFVDTKKMILMK